MAAVIGMFLCLGVAGAVFSAIGMEGLIALLIGGGIGFAIGSTANLGWSIFGAVLGGLIGAYLVYKNNGGSAR